LHPHRLTVYKVFVVTLNKETPGKTGTRIFLVDDHPLVRERLAEIINREEDLQVCGEAEDRHNALDRISRCTPELVVVDLTLKNSDGLELIKDIRSRWPKMRVLVVSMHDESLYAERVIRAGASGYITKQEATRNILVALRHVLGGSVYLNEKIVTTILNRLTRRKSIPQTSPGELLTDRELQVLEMTGHGFSIRQISEHLHIGVKTVETYRTRIREKLELKQPADLLKLAISWAHSR
jgi:DNA-binding NarL/FixJ family response regulator